MQQGVRDQYSINFKSLARRQAQVAAFDLTEVDTVPAGRSTATLPELHDNE
jgi:hypothetical protein